MKCKNCGTEFNEGFFCPECGTRYETENDNKELLQDKPDEMPTDQTVGINSVEKKGKIVNPEDNSHEPVSAVGQTPDYKQYKTTNYPVLALVFGILTWISVITIIGPFICTILAISFGIQAIKKIPQKKGMGITGIVITGAFWALIVIGVLASIL